LIHTKYVVAKFSTDLILGGFHNFLLVGLYFTQKMQDL